MTTTSIAGLGKKQKACQINIVSIASKTTQAGKNKQLTSSGDAIYR
jgi:hypothetical protein